MDRRRFFQVAASILVFASLSLFTSCLESTVQDQDDSALGEEGKADGCVLSSGIIETRVRCNGTSRFRLLYWANSTSEIVKKNAIAYITWQFSTLKEGAQVSSDGNTVWS